MKALTLLRRLAEQHDYQGLREACLEVDSDTTPVRILLALADAQLGDAYSARQALDSLDPNTLTIDAQVDLAAVHMALGQIDQAVALLDLSLIHI